MPSPTLKTFSEARPPTFAGAEMSRMKRPSRNEPEPFRGVEEVQRRPGRRGVDDDEVPPRAGAPVGAHLLVELAELLHRHVLLRAREGARDRLVEGVGEDLLRLLGGGVGDDDLVERPLHVEHHRVEGAAGRGVDAGDGSGRVVELGQPHRLGEPAGRVDGEDDDPAALLGRPQRQGRRGRRLADPAGPAAHDDVGAAVGEQRVDVEHRRAGAGRPLPGRHRSPSQAVMRSANSRTVEASTPSALTGRLCSGSPISSRRLRCSASWARRSAWSCASSSRPLDDRVAGRQTSGQQAFADRVPLEGPLGRRGQRPDGQHGLTDLVDDDHAHAQPRRAEVGDGVDRLLHRHLLQERDDVHGRLRRREHLHDRLRLGVDGPHLGEVGHLLVDGEEAHHPAGRRARRGRWRRTPGARRGGSGARPPDGGSPRRPCR